MNIEEKHKIALKTTTKASSSIKFVKNYLSYLNDLDELFLRSLYILLEMNKKIEKLNNDISKINN